MNDPTNWNPDPNAGVLTFATPEDAKRAKELYERVQMESWNAALVAAAAAARTCCDFGPSTTDPQRAYFLGLEDAAKKIEALKR